MRKFVIFFLLAFHLNQNCFAQSLSYKLPENFDQSYNFHPEDALKAVATSNKDNPNVNGAWIEEIYNIQFNYDADRIYLNWMDVEKYLNRYIDTLYKDTLIRNAIPKLNVSVARNIPFFPGGANELFYPINVGYMASLRSESSLAYAIAHQMGHLYASKHVKSKTMERMSYNGFTHSFYGWANPDFEKVAGDFAYKMLVHYNYDLSDVKKHYENKYLKYQVFNDSKGYEQIRAMEKYREEAKKKKRKKVERDENTEQKNNKDSSTQIGKTKLVIDSVFFEQLRKACHNETKQLMFDNADYNACAEIAFVDFLREPKNLKNLYLLTESIRRLMYINPKVREEPFLLHDYDDDDLFYAHKSILYKPDYLFSDYDEYLELKDHPIFMFDQKPFNTYQEAFLYFTNLSLTHNFNEANFSRALYYYGEKKIDSTNKYLDIYINNGTGLNQSLANELRENGQPHINGTKTYILIDNVGNFTGQQFNYYLTKEKAKTNDIIKNAFNNDMVKSDLVIVNELLGSKPKELYQFLKLKANVQRLYQEEDIQTFKKIKLQSKETQDEFSLSKKFNKHFLILTPEYYSLFKEKDYRTLYFIETVHQYHGYMDVTDEAFDTYTGYYLDINAIRPYFKDAVRSGFKTKETDQKIYAELADFIYWKP